MDTPNEPSIADLFLRAGEVLTVPALAQTIDVHPNTVLEWLSSGRLRGFKVGREWRLVTVNVIDDLRKFSNAEAVSSYRDGNEPDKEPEKVSG